MLSFHSVSSWRVTLCQLLVGFLWLSASAMGAVVDTQYGRFQGDGEGTVQAFRGIRFAAPPTGALRFHPPQPPRVLQGVQPALDFAPACPQLVGIDLTENNNSVMAEDCLAVNVWTPKADAKKRPVMVFIHGGAFVEGSARNTWYDGARLAARGDVVVVTLQYRLGVWGFLDLAEIEGEEYAKSGNLGILDQIAALTWVRDNIAAFGGDAANVTIFGESVGATSVGILMAVPAARGLFHKAILQSNSAARVGHDLPHASALAREFLKVAGVHRAKDLEALSMQQVRDAQEKLFSSVFGDSSFGPTWDGVVIPEPAMKMLLAGQGAQVPVLLGTNLDEIRFWSAVEDLPLESKPMALLKRQLDAIPGAKTQQIVDAYLNADQTYGDAVIHLETDLLFRMSSIRMAEAISARQPTYFYGFTYRSTSPITRYESAHSMDVPFVFGNIDDLDVIAFTGRDPRRKRLMDQMQQCWIQFARSGNPNHPGIPTWPTYDSTTRATLELGIDTRVVNDPRAAQRRAWDGVPFDGVVPSVGQASAFLSVNAVK